MSGRPSIDPELMIRMLIVGYCFGIRSERRLCDEVHLNRALDKVASAKLAALIYPCILVHGRFHLGEALTLDVSFKSPAAAPQLGGGDLGGRGIEAMKTELVKTRPLPAARTSSPTTGSRG